MSKNRLRHPKNNTEINYQSPMTGLFNLIQDKELNLQAIEDLIIRNNTNFFTSNCDIADAIGIAFYTKSPSVVELILKLRPNYIDTISGDLRFNLLKNISKHGLVTTMKSLLSKNLTIEHLRSCDNESILHIAVKHSQLKMAYLLFDHNENLVNVLDAENHSVLRSAAVSKYTNLVEMFQNKLSIAQASHDLASKETAQYFTDYKNLVVRTDLALGFMPSVIAKLIWEYSTIEYIDENFNIVFPIALHSEETHSDTTTIHIEEIQENAVVEETAAGEVSFFE